MLYIKTAMCENEYTLSGWAVDDFEPEDIINIEGYCFTSNDAGFLYDGRNPFTGNVIHKKTLELFGVSISKDKHEKRFDEDGNMRLIQVRVGQTRISPIPAVPLSMDNICFYNNRDPFIKYVTIKQYQWGDRYPITSTAYSFVFNSLIVFRVLLKRDYKDEEKYGSVIGRGGFIREQFESIELVHDPFEYTPPRNQTLNFESWLIENNIP